MKKILTAVLMLSILLTGCSNAYDADADTSDTVADTIATTSVTTSDVITTTSEITTVSQAASMQSQATVEVEYSDTDYAYLKDNGFIDLAADTEIWRKYLSCAYTNTSPESSEYGERRSFEGVPYEMTELIVNVSDEEMISRIEKALNVTLVRNETNEYYLCPFGTVNEMRSAAMRCFSEKRFDELFPDDFIREHDGRLFVVDSVGGKPDGVCAAAAITSRSDDRLEAVLAFDNDVFDEMYTITYVFVRQNGGWVVDGNM